jgi:chromosome segregation protein
MAPRLKSLELHGYKTFASRTVFEFPGVITAIVGPNGSGKSNIADSIRWVLGEQSYSLLRGRKTEDMIFAGSEQRPRAGMASATILFDNADGWLPIDFGEVAITRRAYRDGTNEYLLNGQRVRLKEISELLAQSGLAERTYTIIGQGLVDAALSLKPEERRKFFEEAAGIGLYRSRREESLNRLETTRRNLERVQDILSELGPRLQSLEKQARRAQEYERIKADLRLLLRDWYGYHWHRTQNDWLHAREVLKGQEARQQKERQALESVEGELNTLRSELMDVRFRLNEWHGQSAELHRQREKISRELAVLDERQRALQEQKHNLEQDLARLRDDFASRQEKQKFIADEKHLLNEELGEGQRQAAQARAQLDERARQRQQVENALRDARQSLVASQTRQAQLNAHQNEIKQRSTEIQHNQKSTAAAIENDEKVLDQLETQLQQVMQDRLAVQERFKLIDEERARNRAEMNEIESRRKVLFDERAHLEITRSQVKAQVEVLEQAERSFSGLNQGARFLLETAQEGKIGHLRALSQILVVPTEIETAIAAVLGEFLDGVLYSQREDLDPALLLLESGSKGRAILVPKEIQDGTGLNNASSLKDESIFGLAADLVSAPDEYLSLVGALLGNVLVVSDRKAAKKIISRLPNTAKVVTLKGEVFWGNGVIAAGQEGRAGLISRPRQKKELLEGLPRLENDLVKIREEESAAERELRDRFEKNEQLEKDSQQISQELAGLNQGFQQTNLSLEQARNRLEWLRKQAASFENRARQAEEEAGRLVQEIKELEAHTSEISAIIQKKGLELNALPLDELQKEVIHWETTIAVANRALQEAERREEEQKQELANLEKSIEANLNRSNLVDQGWTELVTNKQVQRDLESTLNGEIDELQQQITPAETELEGLEKRYAALQGNQLAAQQAASLADRLANQAQLEVSRLREGLDNLQRRVEDDFGIVAFEYEADVAGPTPLPLEGIVEQLPRLVELPPDLETSINRQRAQLRRMGSINPEAQTEFREVKQRHEFLTNQTEDLKKADADLRQVIAELDDLMKREFRRTFEAVAAEFKQLFTRMFGGGSARLVLVDEDNPNETGIDIEARLPGRREQGLSLLSGGERSLTAVALVFSLLRVSPTPFCVLDEVDAMLDEANVGRFRDLLVELSQNTQFIIVTHNRNTVQAAGVIYGVTMGRDSASQVISLKLDEVNEDLVK